MTLRELRILERGEGGDSAVGRLCFALRSAWSQNIRLRLLARRAWAEKGSENLPEVAREELPKEEIEELIVPEIPEEESMEEGRTLITQEIEKYRAQKERRQGEIEKLITQMHEYLSVSEIEKRLAGIAERDRDFEKALGDFARRLSDVPEEKRREIIETFIAEYRDEQSEIEALIPEGPLAPQLVDLPRLCQSLRKVWAMNVCLRRMVRAIDRKVGHELKAVLEVEGEDRRRAIWERGLRDIAEDQVTLGGIFRETALDLVVCGPDEPWRVPMDFLIAQQQRLPLTGKEGTVGPKRQEVVRDFFFQAPDEVQEEFLRYLLSQKQVR